MILQDFKPGPLDLYRKKASFDWKKLKLFLDGEDIIRYENELYAGIENHPDFCNEQFFTKNLDTTRQTTLRRVHALKAMGYFSMEKCFKEPKKFASNTRIVTSLCAAVEIKLYITYTLFRSSIINLGTERHLHFVKDNDEDKIVGCYCLTEVGHGSNVRGLKTYATYNKKKQIFVLNSPNFEAAKIWAGGLGKTATHGTVYAQLILDDVNYGLHAFVVPLRNPNTLLPYPGLTLGDMGEKIGLDGVDNGFVMFHNYEIPRENLLNKIADVTEDGRYLTKLNDPSKRLGASLGSLSVGRTNISITSEALGIKALTIAIRYAAVRKQFGLNDNEEIPILEYQSHQNRLLPHLAAAYVIRNYNSYFSVKFLEFLMESQTVGSTKPELAMEIHALSSASKSVIGWTLKDAIQECREACGGHGYLKVAGIGDIRNDYDPSLTYEGENHVLIQQTSNWLLKFWPRILQKQNIFSPLQSVGFLAGGLDILTKSKFNTAENLFQPESIIKVYQWLVVYLLKRTYEKLENERKLGKDKFRAKNDTQVYFAKTLAIAFIQHYFLQNMLTTIQRASNTPIKNVLTKLFILYGLFSLEKHIPYLYQGGYTSGSEFITSVHDGILKICAEVKNDAVALIDAIAPPDFVLNSILGMSDGKVYKHLEEAMVRASNAFNRPSGKRKEVISYNVRQNKL